MASQKWFTGEGFESFCAGTRGSPGGPIGVATLVMIVADDLQERGVARGAGVPEEAEAPAPTAAGNRGAGVGAAANRAARGRGRGRGRGAFLDRRTSTAVVVAHPGGVAVAERAELQHVPTRLETECDAEDLEIIRKLFGSRAQTLINILLAWDGFFAWYFPLHESIPFMCPMPQREVRALDNMQRAIDMKDIFERVSIKKSGSFLPHGATHKVTQDILTVGDVWATDLSPLELQNAETKRVAESSGARRLELSSSGQ